MNRRELLKSLPVVAAIAPTALKTISPDDRAARGNAYPLEEGPWYLFVIDGSQCDTNHFIRSFEGSKIRGSVMVAFNGDVDNFCRIYKLDEK